MSNFVSLGETFLVAVCLTEAFKLGSVKFSLTWHSYIIVQRLYDGYNI